MRQCSSASGIRMALYAAYLISFDHVIKRVAHHSNGNYRNTLRFHRMRKFLLNESHITSLIHLRFLLVEMLTFAVSDGIIKE